MQLSQIAVASLRLIFFVCSEWLAKHKGLTINQTILNYLRSVIFPRTRDITDFFICWKFSAGEKLPPSGQGFVRAVEKIAGAKEKGTKIGAGGLPVLPEEIWAVRRAESKTLSRKKKSRPLDLKVNRMNAGEQSIRKQSKKQSKKKAKRVIGLEVQAPPAKRGKTKGKGAQEESGGTFGVEVSNSWDMLGEAD